MATRALTDIQGKDGALKILLIGDAREDLPGVRDEFREIIDSFSLLEEQGYLHANLLVGQDLTIQKFELRVSNTRYTIIHYAGHTMGNGLVLPFADSDVDTREFIRIVNLNPPTLLVMDACNSLGDPEELDLMTPLIVGSGAVFAIGTSSIVRDDLPAEVFPLFYGSLMHGRTFGEALRDAERRHRGFLKQYFLLGDSSARLNNPPPKATG